MTRCALIHGFAGDPATWDDVIAAWQLPVPPKPIALPGNAVAGCDVVVGYSLGARVGLGLVATGRVAHGVLIGLNPGINESDRTERKQFDGAWARMLRAEPASFADAWAAQPLFATQVRASAVARERRRARRLALDPEQLARSLEAMGLGAMPDYKPAVAAHRDRIALLAGADDAKYIAIAQTLSVRSFGTIPGSGHDPTLEQPVALADAIARAVQLLLQ